jgi:hypothetical protein
MKLLTPANLVFKLHNCHLIIDTNVLLHAVDNEEFYDFLLNLKSGGCAMMTIPSVIFEFARGAKSVKEYNWYVDYVNNLGVGVYKFVEDRIAQDKAFSVLLQTECKKHNHKPSYTDFLLLLLLHKFSHSEDNIFLMTSNYRDIPLSIFDREELMALEYGDSIQTQGIYKNSNELISSSIVESFVGVHKHRNN